MKDNSSTLHLVLKGNHCECAQIRRISVVTTMAGAVPLLLASTHIKAAGACAMRVTLVTELPAEVSSLLQVLM